MFQEPPQQTHLLTAFAVVIESSLEIAQEWPNPLFAYFTHLVKRVHEAHQPARLSVAFVGYGTADTVPSPILCKRFFSDNRMVYKEAFDDPLHFGIGKTNSGGNRGMSALEGLVSALEMFDALHNVPNTKIAASYILHIAANPPDNSSRPLWNDSVMMDDVNWELLPHEFKTRNISYNLLTLKSPPGQLSDLYAAVNGDNDSSPLWFELRPPHRLLASTISALAPAKVPAVPPSKPQSEAATTERTPDSKRPRLQSTADSPKLAAHKPVPTVPPSRPSQPPSPPPSQSSTQSQPQPQSQSQSQSLPPAQPVSIVAPPAQQPPQAFNPRLQFVAGVTLKDAEERIQTAEENLKAHLKAIERVQEGGDPERSKIILQEYTEKRLHIEKMKNIMNQYKQQLKQESPMPMAHNPQSQHQNPSPTQHKIEDLGSPFVLNAGKSHQPASSELGIRPSPNIPQSNVMNPAANLQIQKMIEQQQLTQHLAGLPHSAAIQSSNTSPPSGPIGLFPAPGVGVGGMDSMAGASSASGQQPPVPHWTGMLKWFSDGGRQEMKCAVSLSNVVTVHKMHVNTWPSTMTLQPGGRFSMAELLDWAKKSQPCLCAFKPALSDANQIIYKALLEFLMSRQIFATAAWTTPNGNTSRNILFFPHVQQGEHTLAAAVSPLTGFPDLPTSMPSMSGLHQSPPDPSSISLPPVIARSLANMPLSERQQVIARYILSQGGQLPQQLQQQLQQQALLNQQIPGPGGLSSFTPNTPNPSGPNPSMVAALNMMSAQSHGNPMMNITPPNGVLGNALGGPMPMNPMGGMPHNVNSDMFTSFLQRNAGNGMNMGHNMGQNP